jgi:predicted CopG family antitoxin
MKKILPFILVCLASLIIGFLIGKSMTSNKQAQRSLSDVKKELLSKEINKIDSLVTGEIKLDQKSSGYYYSKSDYIVGSIENNSLIAVAKDVKFTIDYLTETEATLQTDTFNLYKFLKPMSTITISEEVYPPEGTYSINFKIIKVEVDTTHVLTK